MKPISEQTFYFVRHGETDANKNGLMCGGGWDVPLNETGQKQAEKLASLLKELSPTIDHLCVSPMLRTQQTAKAINNDLKAPVRTAEGLREWRVGDWDKQPWEDVPNPFHTKEDPPGGETREVFEERVVNTVHEELLKSEETVLFVAHGAVAHALFTYLGVYQNHINNCEIYKVSPVDKKWTLQKC